jgi:hypothetical protein
MQILLYDVNRLLQLQKVEEPYELSKDQINAISEARNNIAEGNTKSNDDVNNFFEKWLKE